SYIEHSPLLSPDGKRLYFSRQYHPDNIGGVDDNEDIWYSELDPVTGEWQPAKNIGSPLNNSGPNFISSINQVGDETVLLLGNRYESKGRMVSGVSMATIDKDGNISKPKNIDIEDDYNYSPNADFFIADNQEVMLMSVERDDTEGNRDLYVSFKKKNEDWTAPKNIGNNINTIGEEASPFLANDQSTLYFSSNGYSGYGQKDIYVSKRLDDTWLSWSEPENLGKGVNTAGDDVYFNIPKTGKHIYFTRGDVDENTDIFSFEADDFLVKDDTDVIADNTTEEEDITENPIVAKEVVITVKGNVLNSKNNNPLAAKVIVERLPDGMKVGEVNSNATTGAYEINLKPGARYSFRAQARGYIAEAENMNVNETAESKTITQDLYMEPIEKGASIVINNIFFDFDKDELKTASYPELERILKLLQQNRIERIQVSGHTDSIGPEDYNERLARRRANTVYNYFVSKGIAKDRMEVVSFGEKKPTHPNDTITNRKKNRRVEFKVLQVQ
ncbi:MAG: OmpA family protein, partial [Cyclobacteriaceae bacterium]